MLSCDTSSKLKTSCTNFTQLRSMAGGQAYHTTTTETQAFAHRSLKPHLMPIPPTSDFLGGPNLYAAGSKKMADLESPDEVESGGDEEYEGCFQPCAKKRRLAANQVQFLEKSFEVENKLEPERKAQLAKQLGLQPRQVAIWFQNRRAWYKTKQLEKDYGALKAKFDELCVDYDGLVKDGDGLRQQLASLKEKLIEREKAKEATVLGGAMNGKQDASSVKSDVVDSGSPRMTGEFWHETANSVSHVFRPDNYSDGFLQDDEDKDPFNQRLRIFPKLELGSGYGDYPSASSCKIEFSEEENQFWEWPY